MLCEKPIYLLTTRGYVPCGRCLPCSLNKRKKKASRLVLESHDADNTLFVTATYNDVWLPTDYCHHDGRYFSSLSGTLNPRHCQLFLKRLRDAVHPNLFRVAYAGEYGDKGGRPHYHFIFFNFPGADTWRMYESWHDEGSDEPMCAWERFTIETPKSNWDPDRDRLSPCIHHEGTPRMKEATVRDHITDGRRLRDSTILITIRHRPH